MFWVGLRYRYNHTSFHLCWHILNPSERHSAQRFVSFLFVCCLRCMCARGSGGWKTVYNIRELKISSKVGDARNVQQVQTINTQRKRRIIRVFASQISMCKWKHANIFSYGPTYLCWRGKHSHNIVFYICLLSFCNRWSFWFGCPPFLEWQYCENVETAAVALSKPREVQIAVRSLFLCLSVCLSFCISHRRCKEDGGHNGLGGKSGEVCGHKTDEETIYNCLFTYWSV